MSDAPPNSNEDPNPEGDSMAAFSTQLSTLTEALDVLYIPYNSSGRNKFREKHEAIASFIFGSQLIQYDNEGTKDYDHRAELEKEANDRRLELKVTLSEMIDKSVDKGMLQFDYVGSVIDKYGVELSQFLYKGDIIERVRPNLLATIEGKDHDIVQKSQSQDGSQDSVQGDEDVVVSPIETPEQTPEPKQAVIESLEEENPLSEEEKSILSNAPTPVEESAPAPAEEPAPVSYKSLFNSAALGK